MRSSSDADARPVRTVLNSLRACSTDLSIRVCASWISSSTVATTALLRSLDDRTDLLAGDDAADVAARKLEDVDRELVVHAERERRRVHDLQPTLDRGEMRELRDELRRGIDLRVAVVDTFDAVLRHEDRVRADLEGAQRRRGVRREERVAGACGEDDDAAFLEVPDRATPDVRLGDLRHA